MLEDGCPCCEGLEGLLRRFGTLGAGMVALGEEDERECDPEPDPEPWPRADPTLVLSATELG